MKNKLILLLIFLSAVLWAEPVRLELSGPGITESGKQITGTLFVDVDIEPLREAFATKDYETVIQATQKYIILRGFTYGENMEEHTAIFKELLDPYTVNADYQMAPIISNYGLDNRAEGIYELQHTFYVFEPGKENSAKAILMVNAKGQNPDLKIMD